MMPRVLAAAAVIHFHDIVLPGHYWKDWVRGRRFYWTEQYLLHAFLMFNEEFRVIWAARLIQREAEADLAAAFHCIAAAMSISGSRVSGFSVSSVQQRLHIREGAAPMGREWK